MTVFVLTAIFLVAIALLAVLVPLLRKAKTAPPTADSVALSLGVLREQLAELEREFAAGNLSAEIYAQEKTEIERRALEDGQRPDVQSAPDAPVAGDTRRTKLAVVIGIALPILVLGLYFVLGSYQALDGVKPSAHSGRQEGAHEPQQIEVMVERLSKRLKENPDDGPGWEMLARSYGFLERYKDSAAAFRRAVSLLPPDAQLLADFADMLAMTQDGGLQGEPEKLVRQALEVNPRNIKALALSGTIAFERKDYPGAIGEWRKILAEVPDDSSIAASIRAGIADAEKQLANPGAPGR